MMSQQSLFDKPLERPAHQGGIPSLDRFQGAMLFGAVGDALGWPTEFLQPQGNYKPRFALPLRNFIAWRKLVGGKFWGYQDEIAPGSYSDDTQLVLAVARCIAETGAFEPERFAYEELPLWLHYQRGGGKSIKTAARKLIGRKANWLHNFYKQGDLDYRTAGANGGAMRNLPIALARVTDEAAIIADSFVNTIITHGHPRAILGTILFGLSVNYALTASHDITIKTLVEYLRNGMERIDALITENGRLTEWIENWEQADHNVKLPFRTLFRQTYEEVINYLENIPRFLDTPSEDYYKFVGAFEPATKGSGTATVCAAIYLFLKYVDSPFDALIGSVNALGSDTDTISSFLGALLGAYHGLQAVPNHLLNQLQDKEYLLETSTRLHSIATKESPNMVAVNRKIDRMESYLKILTWEIGLHEIFWDAIDVGGRVAHPTLGCGTITSKIVEPIRHEGYVAKLIHIRFDVGQSCLFHSRVKDNDKVDESLAQAVEKALEP